MTDKPLDGEMTDVKTFPVALDMDLVSLVFRDELTAQEATIVQNYRNQSGELADG